MGTLYAVYGRLQDVSKHVLKLVARFNVAFRAFKSESTLHMAIDEFTHLLESALEESEAAEEEKDYTDATPQLCICLMRALYLYLADTKDWSGVWPLDNEPTIEELREMMKSFFHN